MGIHPTPPRGAYRIGITGHRPYRLPAAILDDLTSTTRELLELIVRTVTNATIEDDESSAQPAVCLVSQLAAGADTLVSKVALELNLALRVVLPLPRLEYRADFSGDERTDFDGLLARATNVFELANDQPDRGLSYRAAGEFILEQCDLLLVIWDGGSSAGIGGTAEILERASGRQLPVVLIHTQQPKQFSFGSGGNAHQALAEFLSRQMSVPADHEYWTEEWPTWTPTLFYSFLRLVGDRKLAIIHPPSLAKAGTEIQHAALRPSYAWMDALATHYGELSRSAGFMLQLLAMISVASALLIGVFTQHARTLQILSVLEFVSTASIILMVAHARIRGWHRRWLRYRSLAEQIRCMDFLLPLGGALPMGNAFGFATDDQKEAAFSRYFSAAAARAQGMPDAIVTEELLRARVHGLLHLMASQKRFHRNNARRYEAVDRLLRRAGAFIFLLACLSCVFDILLAFNVMQWKTVWLPFSAALLPALGAAAAGISAQAELRRLANRSSSMSNTLAEMHSQLERCYQAQPVPAALSYHSLTLRSVGEWAARLAEILMYEVRDWQILVSSKPPERS